LRKLHLLWFCGLTAVPIHATSRQLLQSQSLSIVCFGSRTGLEPRFFQDSGFSRALGLDIADTANVFPYMMQHDFHEPRPLWVNPFDVLYSNSFDHAYCIDKFLLSCRSYLNDCSLIIFDYSPRDNSGTPSKGSADCLSIPMLQLIDRVYACLGYKCVLQIPADPNLSQIWSHYKDLKHLFFMSPNAYDKYSSLLASISHTSFICCNSQASILEYMAKMHSYTREHLEFINPDSTIRF